MPVDNLGVAVVLIGYAQFYAEVEVKMKLDDATCRTNRHPFHIATANQEHSLLS